MMKPASLFTDGAVLCRGKEIRIFGRAEAGEPVTSCLYSREGALLAQGSTKGRDGRFLIFLRPQEAQSGCRLVIEGEDQRFEAADVAIGEVYLAGGQSNMEWELRNSNEGPDLIRDHRDPLLRFYNVPRKALRDEDQRKAADETRWHAVTPGQGGENSAVAYFFARKLRERMPQVPVGIIGCYWGGTSISCWIREEALRTDAEGQRYLEKYAREAAGKTMDTWLKEEKQFQDTLSAWNATVADYQGAHPEAPWPEVEKACGPAPWFPPAGPGSPYRPCGLAESMVMETVPAALTGILYYQGESDADRTDHYDRLMGLLIRHWRELYRDAELPFLFAQLPMWVNYGAADSFRWPLIRLQQAAARDAARNTGMVCLLDQGEYGNLHPRVKRPVGERLAELAGHMLYGGGEISPKAVGKYTEGDTLTVCLSAPVTLRGEGAPALLEIAEAEGPYLPAEAEVWGERLSLRAKGAANPVRVRYAWTDYSDRVNLFGANGLPLEPFEL